jgi:hypothetical protein
MSKVRYRCHLAKKEETLLPDKAQKELDYLRKRLKDKDDEILYLIYCILGDEPPGNIAKKFGKMYNF